MPIPAGPTDAIVTFNEVKAHLNFHGIDTGNDAELQGFIDTAVSIVQSGQLFGPIIPREQVSVVTPATLHGFAVLDLPVTPILSLTTCVGAYGYATTIDVAGLYPNLKSGMVRAGLGVTLGCYPLEVTYQVGRDYTPPEARMMALDLIRINWRPQQGGNRSAYDEGDLGTGAVMLGFFVPDSMKAALGDEAQPLAVA